MKLYAIYSSFALDQLFESQVADCCKPYNVKDALLEGSDALESRGIHMLGQMRHGSCHPRAILFKVLADAAGVDSTLVAVSTLSAELSLACVLYWLRTYICGG